MNFSAFFSAKTFGMMIVVAAGVLGVSCGSSNKPYTDEDVTPYVNEITKAEVSGLKTDSINLYVDYSTCLATALTSPYFQAVQPTIISNKPIYYSIKGDKIQRETGDVYQLLRGIKEVNHANIKGAAQAIVNDDRQAILLTDAEYWLKNLSGDNLNNPYMRDEIAQWLSAGRDIYIYAEPYLEANKYNKYRYYFVFTDDRLPEGDNFNNKFQKSVGTNADVKMLHLTAKAPKAKLAEGEYPVIAEASDLLLFDQNLYNKEGKEGVNYISFDQKIQPVAEALIGQKYNKKGESIGDLPLITGLVIESLPSELYTVEDLNLKVYNVMPQAADYVTPKEDEEGNEIAPVASTQGYEEVVGLLKIDKDAYTENGAVNIMFDDINCGFDINNPVLLRVDVLANKVKANVDADSQAAQMLSWQSLSAANQGMINNSLLESVKQVAINDKNVQPTNEGNNVVYTCYIYFN